MPVCAVGGGGPERAREISSRWRSPSCGRTDTTELPHDDSQSWRGGRVVLARGKTLRFVHRSQAVARGHPSIRGPGRKAARAGLQEVLPYFGARAPGRQSTAGGFGTSGPQFGAELRDRTRPRWAFLAACGRDGYAPSRGVERSRTMLGSPCPVYQRRGLRHSAAEAPPPREGGDQLDRVTGGVLPRIVFDGSRATGVETWSGRVTHE